MPTLFEMHHTPSVMSIDQLFVEESPYKSQHLLPLPYMILVWTPKCGQPHAKGANSLPLCRIYK